MKIENLKLFTEYERQFKRKYPGLKYEFIPSPGAVKFQFSYINGSKEYSFVLTADNPPKNGDVECTLSCVNNDKDIKFDESRKPMEMNVDNAVNAAIYLILGK